MVRFPRVNRVCLIASAIGLVALRSAHGATWDGGGTDGFWQSAANWQADAAPVSPEGLAFGGTVRLVNTNDFSEGTRFDRLVYLPGAGAFTLNGNAISLGGDIENRSGSGQTVNLCCALLQDTMLDLGGQALTINAVLSDDGHGHRVTKTGTGTLNLRRANTFTGGMLVRQGGLDINFSASTAPASHMLPAEGALEIGGDCFNTTASFITQSKTSVQSFSTTAFQGGRTYITLSRGGSSGSITLNLGTPSRSSAGLALFNALNTTTTRATVAADTPLVNGILGAWATIGSDWVTHSGGQLAALGSSGYTIVGDTGTIPDQAAAHVSIATSTPGTNNLAVAGMTDIHTLRLITNTNRVLNIGGGNTLRLGPVGAIWRISTGIANSLTISGGTLTAGGAANSPGELVMNAAGATGDAKSRLNTGTDVQSSLADNGSGALTLVKTGAQTVRLRGTNPYSGGTHVLQGRLIADSADSLGSGPIRVYQDTGSEHGSLWLYGTVDCTNDITLAGLGTAVQFNTISYSCGALAIASPSARVTGTITLAGESRIATAFGVTGTILGRITGDAPVLFGTGNQSASILYLCNTSNDWTGNTTLTVYSSSSNKHMTLRLGASEVIPNGPGKGDVILSNTSGNTGAHAFLELSGFSETINGLRSAGTTSSSQRFVRNSTSAAPAATLTLGDNDASAEFLGTVDNGHASAILSLRKIGSGTQVLSGGCGYSGATVVDDGVLAVSGSITGTSGITINGSGAFHYTGGRQLTRNVALTGGTFRHSTTNGTGYGGALTFTDGRLSGTNWLGNLSGLSIGDSRTVAPGDHVGTAYGVNQTWAAGGAMEIELADAAGTAGSGWDLMKLAGSLDLSALASGSPFTIRLLTCDASGRAAPAANFDPSMAHSWRIAAFGSLTGTFDRSRFMIDASAFLNERRGSLSLVQEGSALAIRYVPTAGTALILR